MGLDWLMRDKEIKNHSLFGKEHWGKEPPCTVYEKKHVLDEAGSEVEGLYSAWITLNNPAQYNSYTTEMVKGVIAGFQNASLDRSIVAVVFTAVGDRAFCTGGNTKEYAEYYAGKPNEYGEYMDLFNGMVDSILMCKKRTMFWSPCVLRTARWVTWRVAGRFLLGISARVSKSRAMGACSRWTISLPGPSA